MFHSLFALPLIFATSAALAADAEHKAEETKDVSHNPITGTNTVTKINTRKVKEGGHTYQAKTRDKTKVKSDGTTETKSETETSHAPE